MTPSGIWTRLQNEMQYSAVVATDGYSKVASSRLKDDSAMSAPRDSRSDLLKKSIRGRRRAGGIGDASVGDCDK